MPLGATAWKSGPSQQGKQKCYDAKKKQLYDQLQLLTYINCS